MISNELAAKFHLPPIDEYPFPELDWYHTFLIQSDYVAMKVAEAIYLGKQPDEDMTEIIAARDYCRQKINELEVQEGEDGTNNDRTD